ncbi:MAG: four helix bundle protein [Bacteroidales bacterium]|nr:four helix bundle protein [Bacteroidales bacterium]
MTKKEIFEFEKSNPGVIRLYPEGTFYKAYEQSAYALCKYVHAFKVSCNYVKTIGDYIVGVGFPKSSLQKWAGGRNMIELPLGILHLSLYAGEAVDSESFQDWKAGFINESGQKPERRYDYVPVFGLTYRLALEITQLCANLDKTYKYSLGEDLRKAATELVLDVSVAVKARSKLLIVRESRIELQRVNLALRLLTDLHQIKEKRYVYFMEMTADAATQLLLWERSLGTEEPAGVPLQ